MTRFRLGLIGCGGMGSRHAEGFDHLEDRVRVTVAVDIEPRRARAVADQFPGCRTVTDYRAVLDDVDGVLIALPHRLHHPAARFFLDAGKHVLLEKPMATTEEHCLDLIAASQRANRVLMTAYVMRFNPLVIRMKQLLDQRAYGDVFQVSIWTEQFTRLPGQDGLTTVAWLGGGQLLSHGCHYIDILLWFLGRPVRGTHLGTNTGTPWMEREGTSHVTIEFEGGALGYHFGTWGARGTKLGYSFQAHCTEGMLEIDYTNGQLLLHSNLRGEQRVAGRTEVLLDASTGLHPGRNDAVRTELGRQARVAELSHFLDCVETGIRPLTDGPGSLQGLRLIWRLYQAEEQGVVADLSGLGLDEYRD
ncbi:MAG: Gfo/Idh/MocA family oxidoreductase [Chloroflexota bacterium]|nr:Gfo/Idh/MocA family oxidoreductase [Chloroflexota bacterium]MDE2920448.1 Gfo/Idh/MocA family oxidoreductase [Chloroflexota bacterium]